MPIQATLRPTAEEHETVGTHRDRCPDCDSDVVDGQGVLDCVDCEWSGVVR